MTLLADQQQALLDALFTRAGACAPGLPPNRPAPAFHGARGLQAYRVNGQARAERSLLAVYPVLAQLLGEESFAALARDHWLTHPPQTGDLAQWGGALAGFVQASPQLAGEPYLADVARVEWALHRCAMAIDADPDPASFALLAQAAPATLVLRLASGTAIVASPYPVASIVCAHLQAAPALDEAGRRLRAGVSESALVWRQGLRPRVRPCDHDEAAFLRAALAGAALTGMLDAAPGFALDRWLPRAVQDGLVLAVAARAA